MTSDYTLRLGDTELHRYRMMAAQARANETVAWQRAGIDKGARIADIGCGPGLPLLELADVVGPDGRVVGVDQDAEARATATALLADAGIAHVEIVDGDAADTGLPGGEWDVVHMRHVLLHNGPRIGAILGHAWELLRPGGHVYLNETDAAGISFERDLDPDIADLNDRYWGMLADRGNDISVGPHLGRYVAEAGFEIVHRQARFDVVPLSPEIRPPSWAGRQAMLDAGLCTEADIQRWDIAISERTGTGCAYVPQFTVVGRRAG